MAIVKKLLEWMARYGLPEACGTVSALSGAAAVFALTQNEVASAYGGAMAENFGFYTVMVTREIRADRRSAAAAGLPYGRSGLGRTLRNLLIEFGPAEIADTGFIRPLAMGLGAHFLDRHVGVLVGKIAGDIIFYIPVILTYELRQWRRCRSN